jgi:hypothetical protein
VSERWPSESNHEALEQPGADKDEADLVLAHQRRPDMSQAPPLSLRERIARFNASAAAQNEKKSPQALVGTS